MDVADYMTQCVESPAVLDQADGAYSEALADLLAVIPAGCRDKVLRLEAAANRWACVLSEHYFVNGVAVGLQPARAEAAGLRLRE